MLLFPLIPLLLAFRSAHASHYRGGTISWAPVDPAATFPTASVQIKVTARFFWNLLYPAYVGLCDSNACIAAGTLYGDASGITSTSAPVWTLDSKTNCYAFSAADVWSAGQRTQTQSVITSSQITARFTSSAWISGVISITGCLFKFILNFFVLNYWM